MHRNLESSDGQVTIVVATQNRRDELEHSLTRHQHPVILIDNASIDGTVAFVRERFPEVHVVELDRNRGAVARNVGVRLARTPYVAFADDDSWWAPGALDIAADQFETHPRMAVLAAQIRVGPQESLDPVCLEMAGSALGSRDDLPGPSILGFLACGAVVRRTAYLDAGGFDDVIFFMGEEERLALDLAALGWGLAYVDKVIAHHHPSSARDPFARAVRATRNRLLTTVLRRPWPVVASTAAAALRGGPVGRTAVKEAVKRLPGALHNRRLLPASVEADRRLLDASTSPPQA